MTPPLFPQLRTYLVDDLFLNEKTNNNIRISHSLKYKNSKKKKFFTKKLILVLKESSINKNRSISMSFMLCTRATFVKKNSRLVARIVPFDIVGLHLLTLRILEPYPSKDIALDLSHVIQISGIIIVHFLSLIWINASKFPNC